MKTILCPIDFSDSSLIAAKWAAMVALRINAQIVLLNKFNIYSKKNKYAIYHAEDPYTDAKVMAEGKLLQIRSKLITKYNIQPESIEVETIYGIDIDDIIVNSAKEIHADLIVMSTQGAENMGDFILGSNTTHVIKKAPIPVLVVPQESDSRLPQKIIYATDLKNEDNDILTYAIEFAEAIDACVTFLFIDAEGEMSSYDLKLFINDRLNSALTESQLKKIDFEVIRGKNLYALLEGYAEKHGSGLIVLGNHHKNFFQKLREGDFTRVMALYSFIPLLVLQKND